MKIIVCHNYYRQRGGEDLVFEDEVELLAARGHEVSTFIRRNDEFSGLETIKVAAGTVWNRSSSRALADLVREEGADIVHFHNWLPQISMGSYYGARKAGAAIVQTLHNYRFTCAQGLLYRDGAICEECVGKKMGLPALRHACYRDSRLATLPVVLATATHRAIQTVPRTVDATIVLSEFARGKLTEAGLPPDRVHVKPNFFATDPGERRGDGGYVLFLGRLSGEKGIQTMIDAWELMEDPPPLKIAGSGPMAAKVESFAASNSSVEYLGLIPSSDVPDVLGGAMFNLVPSINYEGFPRTVVESFAVGTPVIASDLGTLSEVIRPYQTGFLADVGSPASLAQTVKDAVAHPGIEEMRHLTRHEFVTRYNADLNYEMMIAIYEAAIEARHSDR